MRESGRDALRRQSSGSSVYTKSDVDSEFSKDFGEEGSAFGDGLPSGKSRELTPQATWPGAISSTPVRARALSNGKQSEIQGTPLMAEASPMLDDTTTPVADSSYTEEESGKRSMERQTLGRLSFVLGMDEGVRTNSAGGKGTVQYNSQHPGG